jgi:hypothetical protein
MNRTDENEPTIVLALTTGENIRMYNMLFVFFEFSLATNPTTARWTEPVTIWNILQRRNKLR